MSRFEPVYKLVRQIPKGKVSTYGTIAKKLGINPRVVGYALHINPDPKLTPCHRVVNAQGRVAPGYAFGGHDAQRKILEKEGIHFKDDKNLDIRKYIFEY